MKKLIAVILIASMNFCFSQQDIDLPGIKFLNKLEYPSSNSQMNMKFLNNLSIDEQGFIFIKDGHFKNKSGRVRFFGINLTFDSLFPSHEIAEKIAKQIAGLGINIIRIHHIDNKEIWGRNFPACTEFDQEKLEKLDYFISELKKNGIYVNLNLHVSWNYRKTKINYPEIINSNYTIRYGKGIDNFMDELIELQKEYAGNLLNHKNKYTNLLYKDDPVIAMIEINNENSFYKFILSEKVLDDLPKEITNELKIKWQKFLTDKYKNFEEIAVNWETEKKSKNVSEIKNIIPFNEKNNWTVQIGNKERGEIILENNRIIIKSLNEKITGFFQCYYKGLTFEKDEDYTVLIEIKGSRGSTFRINAMRSVEPWGTVGLNNKVTLINDDFTVYKFGFNAKESLDKIGRITLGNFENGKEWAIKSIKIFKGKVINNPLERLKNIDEINLPILREFNLYPEKYQSDFIEFSKLTERGYWKTMIEYLKKDVGVKVPITGTQLDYAFFDVQDLFDYIDVHNYWEHPSFPGKPWDGKNYYVDNVSMIPEKNNTFSKIALCRISGKPFTVSEYNHPFPLDYSQEAITICAVTSKLQDYDGIFYFNLFNKLDTEGISYFAIFNSFIKKSLFPVSSYVFRSDKIEPLKDEVIFNIGKEAIFTEALKLGKYTNPYLNKMSGLADVLKFDKFKIGSNITEGRIDISGEINKIKIKETDDRLFWINSDESYFKNNYKFDTENANVYIGWTNFKDQVQFKKVMLLNVKSNSSYFQFTIFNKKGNIGSKGIYIVTLSSKNYYSGVEYLDYKTREKLVFKNDNHGKRIMAIINNKKNTEYMEPVEGVLSMDLDEKPVSEKVEIYTINDLGEKANSVKFDINNRRLNVNLKKEYSSIVYIIEIK